MKKELNKSKIALIIAIFAILQAAIVASIIFRPNWGGAIVIFGCGALFYINAGVILKDKIFSGISIIFPLLFFFVVFGKDTLFNFRAENTVSKIIVYLLCADITFALELYLLIKNKKIALYRYISTNQKAVFPVNHTNGTHSDSVSPEPTPLSVMSGNGPIAGSSSVDKSRWYTIEYQRELLKVISEVIPTIMLGGNPLCVDYPLEKVDENDKLGENSILNGIARVAIEIDKTIAFTDLQKVRDNLPNTAKNKIALCHDILDSYANMLDSKYTENINILCNILKSYMN